MEYREVLQRDRAEIESLLQSSESIRVKDALLSAAYYDPDWRWAQNQCLVFLGHDDFGIRSLAAICLGHIARVHRKLDLELVLPRLVELKNDPLIGNSVQDALDDIKFFLKFQ
jgi:hypothetical protein